VYIWELKCTPLVEFWPQWGLLQFWLQWEHLPYSFFTQSGIYFYLFFKHMEKSAFSSPRCKLNAPEGYHCSLALIFEGDMTFEFRKTDCVASSDAWTRWGTAAGNLENRRIWQAARAREHSCRELGEPRQISWSKTRQGNDRNKLCEQVLSA